MGDGSFSQATMVILFGLALGLWPVLLPSENKALARDDGRYANSPLKSWFDSLASRKGLCCSFADGVKVEDVDWDTGGPDGAYRVRLGGKWVSVPADAVITEPNRFGPAVVWPALGADNEVSIRCFIPGAGT